MMDDNTLETWKEIASYLNRRIRTCQRWEQEYGLPVKRYLDSHKSRVFAHKSEIDQWLLSQKNKTRKRKKRFFPQARLPKYTLHLAVISLCVLLVQLILPKAAQDIHSFKIQGSRILLLSPDQKNLGSFNTPYHNFDKSRYVVQKDSLGSVFKTQRSYQIQDIDQDKSKELLFVVRTLDRKHENRLVCLSHRAREKWSFSAGETHESLSGNHLQNHRILGFHTADINQDGHSEILVVSNNTSLRQGLVTLLNDGGQLLGVVSFNGKISDFRYHTRQSLKTILVAGYDLFHKPVCQVIEVNDVVDAKNTEVQSLIRLEIIDQIIFPTNADIQNECRSKNIPFEIRIDHNKKESRLVFQNLVQYYLSPDLKLKDLCFSIRMQMKEFYKTNPESLAALKKNLLFEGLNVVSVASQPKPFTD
ncbi:MAG: hypothetical protein GF421_01575 [Candidatus Aminicenantes bacterium]|nr:hypothetical protein [Candidatus Aminicenantes bacterium]